MSIDDNGNAVSHLTVAAWVASLEEYRRIAGRNPWTDGVDAVSSTVVS